MKHPTPLTPNKYWNSRSEKEKDKLRAAMHVYNSILLDVPSLKLNFQQLMAIDTLACNCYIFDKVIIDAFVPSIRELTTMSVDLNVMDEYLTDFPNYTCKQIIEAMHMVLNDYIDGLEPEYHPGIMGIDIRSAFESDWHVWFGDEPKAHVHMKLVDLGV